MITPVVPPKFSIQEQFQPDKGNSSNLTLGGLTHEQFHLVDGYFSFAYTQGILLGVKRTNISSLKF
jgi:hypothetical protein